MKCLYPLLLVVLASASAPLVAQERPYTEGPVRVVTSVRVEPGQFDNYMAYLQRTWKAVMEAQKQAGIILGYAVHEVQARSPEQPDLYLVVTYPNMASFDGLDERTEPLAQKVTRMDRTKSNQATADRSRMRTILGSEMIRELKLK